MNGIRIASSHVGKGIFATRRFQPEETVGQVQGQLIDDPGYTSDYCMEITARLTLEPDAPFRYLNHSCSPNCELVALGKQIWVEAIHAITPGEQLTIDYAWEVESAIPCACGSKNCRGWIVDETERWKLPA